MCECYNGGGIHFDHAASELTCYTGTEITAAKNNILGGSVLSSCEFVSRLSSQHPGSEAEADDIARLPEAEVLNSFSAPSDVKFAATILDCIPK